MLLMSIEPVLPISRWYPGLVYLRECIRDAYIAK